MSSVPPKPRKIHLTVNGNLGPDEINITITDYGIDGTEFTTRRIQKGSDGTFNIPAEASPATQALVQAIVDRLQTLD